VREKENSSYEGVYYYSGGKKDKNSVQGIGSCRGQIKKSIEEEKPPEKGRYMHEKGNAHALKM
jgi:hypothetical protein